MNKESHYVWGKRYLMEVLEGREGAGIELGRGKLTLRKLPGWGATRCEEMLEEWYRGLVRENALPLIGKWEKRSA